MHLSNTWTHTHLSNTNHSLLMERCPRDSFISNHPYERVYEMEMSCCGTHGVPHTHTAPTQSPIISTSRQQQKKKRKIHAQLNRICSLLFEKNARKNNEQKSEINLITTYECILSSMPAQCSFKHLLFCHFSNTCFFLCCLSAWCLAVRIPIWLTRNKINLFYCSLSLCVSLSMDPIRQSSIYLCSMATVLQCE